MDLGLTYTKIGDYYYPDIALPDTTKYPIGRYGRMHRQYLKEHRPTVWARLVLAGEPPTISFGRSFSCRIDVRISHQSYTERWKNAVEFGRS